MQEGIIQIGKVLMEGSSILDNLISDVPSKVKDKQLHVLKFMFSSLDNSVKLDPYEEMSEESSKKYLFIGSAPGANSKQWYATATNNSHRVYSFMRYRLFPQCLCGFSRKCDHFFDGVKKLKAIIR